MDVGRGEQYKGPWRPEGEGENRSPRGGPTSKRFSRAGTSTAVMSSSCLQRVPVWSRRKVSVIGTSFGSTYRMGSPFWTIPVVMALGIIALTDERIVWAGVNAGFVQKVRRAAMMERMASPRSRVCTGGGKRLPRARKVGVSARRGSPWRARRQGHGLATFARRSSAHCFRPRCTTSVAVGADADGPWGRRGSRPSRAVDHPPQMPSDPKRSQCTGRCPGACLLVHDTIQAQTLC